MLQEHYWVGGISMVLIENFCFCVTAHLWYQEEQDNITLRCVHATIIAMEKKQLQNLDNQRYKD
jgi:hypothetical protein